MARRCKISAISSTGKDIKISSWLVSGCYGGRYFFNHLAEAEEAARRLSETGCVYFITDLQILHIFMAFKDGRVVDFNRFSAVTEVRNIHQGGH